MAERRQGDRESRRSGQVELATDPSPRRPRSGTERRASCQRAASGGAKRRPRGQRARRRSARGRASGERATGSPSRYPPISPRLPDCVAAGPTARSTRQRSLTAWTGRHGKGTSAAAIGAALREAGLEPLLAGNTHFGPPLSASGRCRADVIVAELSSFQLAGSPTLLPEASLFTNIGQQHWDYHGSREAYVAAKRRMFVRGDRAVPTASLNLDYPEGQHLAVEVAEGGGDVVTYGMSAAADYRILECTWSIDRARMRLRTPTGELELETRLPGEHNALNLAGAFALIEALGLGSSATRTA